jgi:hypothetical protein
LLELKKTLRRACEIDDSRGLGVTKIDENPKKYESG